MSSRHFSPGTALKTLWARPQWRRPPRWLKCIVAVMAVVTALGIKLLLDSVLAAGETPFLMFWTAVMVTAWFGGPQPGIYATALAALTVAYFFLPPLQSLAVSHSALWGLAVFISEGTLISVLSGTLHNARQQAEASQRESERAYMQSRRTIEELQRVRDAVELGEVRFRRLVEANIIGVYLTNPDGNLVDANDSFLKMLGATRGDLESGRLQHRTLTAPEHSEVNRIAMQELATEGRCEPFENEFVRLDGSRIPALVGVVRLSEGEDHIIGFALDLTEQKRTEQALADARDVAEAANRTKDEFLASVSHELRTPLNSVIGLTDLVLADSEANPVRDDLATVRESAHTLLVLVNDILDFSKLEAGQFELTPSRFSPARTVEESLRGVRVKADEKYLKLHASIDSDVPDVVDGDELRLRQVLTNLLSNAVRFTDEGEVMVSVSMDSENTEDVTLHFAVRDTGIGIAPEDRDRIFAPFTQADSSLTRQYGGTGLGLAICVKLARLMNGRLWLDSETGQGSTFHCTVRFGKPTSDSCVAGTDHEFEFPPGEPVAIARLLDTPAPHSLCLLVAEDIPANQRLLETVLTRRGHTLQFAENGQQAVDLWANGEFDGILMDVQMPQVDGLRATRRIREREMQSQGHTPIIAMTAHAMQSDREACLQAGMDAYMAKPIDTRRLIELVEQVCHPDGLEFYPPELLSVVDPAETSVGGVTESNNTAAALELAFDYESALARLDGKEELFRDMVQFFDEDVTDLLTTLRYGLVAGNSKEVTRAAHSLKGLVASLSAEPARSAAQAVEEASRSGGSADLKPLVAELERQIAILKEALQPFRNA